MIPSPPNMMVRPSFPEGRKAVFFDKDGTLVIDVPYNVEISLTEFTAGALECARRLHESGHLIVIVSNQPGVALGRFSATALHTLEAHLREELNKVDVPLAGFYACPHAPADNSAGGCYCRKPEPGLLYQAALDLHINLAASWMVGDILHDVEAGRRASCRTILLNVGNETEWKITPDRVPHHIASSLVEVPSLILARHDRGRFPELVDSCTHDVRTHLAIS
jgi:D-glycero-D-manno-heptose 1,7-bisphosphate phosphatase